MTTYVALLRGINLAGKNKVPMKDLRSLCKDLGHEDVRTYVQSGNVIFASRSSASKIAADMENAISETFGIKPSVLLRTRRELERIAERHPFAESGVAPAYLHVMFLDDKPSSKAIKSLDPDRSPPDEFVVDGKEVYLLFPKGSGRSKLTIDYFERTLGTRATARNWNTLVKVLQMMGSSE